MLEDYVSARRQGLRYMRQGERLAVLDEVVPRHITLSRERVGLCEIPLDMVIGTVSASRARSFAKGFMPISDPGTEFAAKWRNLYDAQIEEGIRDPITCYEYMHRFYVQEGNKRVSVLKYLKVPSIMADVTRILPRRNNTPAVKAYYEFLQFFKACGFYDIELSAPGSYRILANELGLPLDRRWQRDDITAVRGAWFRFLVMYRKIARDVSLQAGEAFLIYLKIFSFDSLLDSSHSVINKRIKMIRNEFIFASDPAKNTVARKPDEVSRRFFSLFSKVRYNENHPLKIAFLYEGDPAVDSWEADHETGRIYIENRFEYLVKTICVTGCRDKATILKGVETAYRQGCEAVFTTSASQMATVVLAAAEYPQLSFYNCSADMPHAGVGSYFGRLYEVKLLLGMLAAMYCDSHEIAYITGEPAYGSTANINAFALGARMIDPVAVIRLYRQKPEDENHSVVAMDDFVSVHDDKPAYGVIKYVNGTPVFLGGVVWNWGIFYEKIIQAIISGNVGAKDKAVSFLWGIDAGVLKLAVSSYVEENSRRLLALTEEAIQKGWRIFPLSDGEIMGMSERLENVITEDGSI